MAAAAYGLHLLLAPWFASAEVALRITALGLLVGGGAAVYGAAALALGAIRLGELKDMAKRRAPR